MPKTRHDGDCHWWSLAKICTCGFLHEVVFNLDKYSEELQDQCAIHRANLAILEGMRLKEASSE